MRTSERRRHGRRERLSRLSRRARTLADRAAVTGAEVDVFHTSGRTARAVEAALGYLRQVGIEWTPHPTEAQVADECARLWQTLGDRPVESLADLPAVSDPDCQATMDVLLATFSPALITDTNLHDLVVARVARLSLAHGNSDASSLAYVRLATIIGRRFGDYAKGFRFGKLGFDLVEQHGLQRFNAAVYLNFAALVIPWTKHLSSGLGLIRRAATTADQTCNISYSCYARTCLITLLLAQGGPLAETQRDVDEAHAYTKARFELVADSIKRAAARAHAPGAAAPVRLAHGRRLRRGDVRGAPRRAHAWRSPPAGTGSESCRPASTETTSPPPWRAPTVRRPCCGRRPSSSRPPSTTSTPRWPTPRATTRWRARIGAGTGRPSSRHAARLAEWARQCPDNFRGRALLADAELARIDGRVAEAERLYGLALSSARAGSFAHDEAVTYEMAARFWRARGHPLFADVYLREASACYRRWGAEGKVQQLQQLTGHHPGLGTPPTISPISLTRLPATSPDQLDLLAVIKASQTISGVMGREELVRMLLQIVIEQGGARLARLVRVRDGELEIAAEQTLAPEKDAGETAEPAARASVGRVPASILHYVARTQERVVLDDAAADAGRFTSDPYLAIARPRSLLCLPIRREGRVVALLYLENELAPGVFTADRLVALELIAAQIAISLENALLLEREREGRVEAEAASRRALILSEATALVSSTFDYQDVFRALTRLCARELSDWAVIDLVEKDHIGRLAAAHRNPAHEPLVRELSQRYPARFGVRGLAMSVIDSGVPKHIPDFAPEDVRRLCEDDRHFEIVQTLGARSALSVPLVVRETRIGALSLGSATPNHFVDADIELVVEIGRRTALAIDNARLLVETQRAVHLRDQFLSTASHELRTPITSLKLTIEALLHGSGARQLPPAAASRLQRVLHSSNRLQHLVNELLDVTRIEQGQATLSPAQMDLAALVRDVVQHLEFDLARAGCRLSVDCPSAVVGWWGREQAGAGGDEPACERHEVRGGSPHRGDGPRRRPGGAEGEGPRHRHRRRPPAEDIRPVRARGVEHPLWWARARPLPGALDRGITRRHDHRGQPAGRGVHVHRAAAPGPARSDSLTFRTSRRGRRRGGGRDALTTHRNLSKRARRPREPNAGEGDDGAHSDRAADAGAGPGTVGADRSLSCLLPDRRGRHRGRIPRGARGQRADRRAQDRDRAAGGAPREPAARGPDVAPDRASGRREDLRRRLLRGQAVVRHGADRRADVRRDPGRGARAVRARGAVDLHH
jgi:GAF domain-containing protein